MTYGKFDRSILALAAWLVATGVPGTPALAQQAKADSDTVLEEVVVTAQKREEKLLDVPISITAIPSDQLEARHMEGLASLNAAAPNLFYRSNPGPQLISTIGIRGQVTGQPAIWVDQSTGVYLDGVYLGKAQGIVMDLVDLERVEVLRGPQGTLFGRNTEAGAISFVSKKPTGQFDGAASVESGNYNHRVGRLSLDLPRFGIVSVSLAARKESMDGWAQNLSGASLGAIDSVGARGAVKFDFTDRFTGLYAFDYSDINDTPNPTSLYALSGWNGTLPQYYGQFGGQAFLIESTAAKALAPYITTSRPDVVSTGADVGPVFDRALSRAHSATLDYRLTDNNELKYIYATRSVHFNDQESLSGTPLTSVLVQFTPTIAVPSSVDAYFNRDTNYTQHSHELQWVGDTALGGGNKLKYVAGLYYFLDNGVTNGNQNFGLLLASPVRHDYNSGTDSKAAFAQLDWTFLDNWTLTVGDRYTRETKSGWTHSYLTNGFGGTLKCDVPAANCTGVLPFTTYSATFSASTPMGAIAYKVNPDLNLYARVAKGFKSGGFSSENISPSVTTPYAPESSVLTEIGVKSKLLGGKAELNFDIFRTKLTDLQLTQLIPGTTQSLLKNAGKATYQGFEFEGAILLTEGWKLQANYGYLDAKFDQYITNAITQLTTGLAAGLYVNVPGTLVDAGSNLYPPYAPKSTINVNLDGRLLKTQKGNLRLIVDYSYVSSVYLYAVNKSFSSANAGGQYLSTLDGLPAMPNLNARLVWSGLPTAGGTAEFSLFAKNLTNFDKPVQGIDFGMLRTANWATPRTWMFTASYKFGPGRDSGR